MTNNELKCRYCNEIKILSSDNFKVEKRTKLGFESVCRPCRRTERNNHRKSNIDVFLKKEANSRKTKKRQDYQKKYWVENKEELNKSARERYKQNPTPYLIRSKEQKIRMGDDYKKYQKQYREKNKERLNEYDLKRHHSDIRRKIRNNLSGAIRKRLNGQIKQSKSIEYVGCTWEFLIGYLESKFLNGMNWQNMGAVWHIDHKIPCRAFDFNDENQIKECFNYKNLQPLFVIDNLKKLDRLPDGTFARNIKK
jgi:hypothetical protein